MHTYYCQYFYTPTLRSKKKVLIYKESSANALHVCCYINWIGGWGVCELGKNNILSLLISTQKLYFGDNDAIYDVIILEPSLKDVIATAMISAGIHFLNYYSFRHTQSFSFLDKSTGPILTFMVLAL